MPLPDLLPALKAFLETGGVTRVFNEELPTDETSAVDSGEPTVVLKSAGGVAYGFDTVGRLRVDVRCYAGSLYEARTLYHVVYELLKQMRAQASEDVWLLSATMESGPFTMRDPDTRWPFALGSWNVLCREVPVSLS